MKEINGTLEAKGLKVGIVVSRFNSFLTEQLVKGAVDAFVRLGGDEKDLVLVRVPGAYELPLAAKKLAEEAGHQAAVYNFHTIKPLDMASCNSRCPWSDFRAL